MIPERDIGRLCLAKRGVPARLWFDNVIACYILLLPLAVFWIAGWFGYTARWLYRSSAFFFIFFYSLCFIISAANIPYFAYFFKPINSSIFNWFDYAGTTAGMVFGETSYYLPIALGLTAIAALLHHPPAVAHVLPFKPKRRAPGKQMESRRLYVCDRNRPYRLVLFRHPRTAGL